MTFSKFSEYVKNLQTNTRIDYSTVADDVHPFQDNYLQIWRRLCSEEVISFEKSDDDIPLHTIIDSLQYIYAPPIRTRGAYNHVRLYKRRRNIKCKHIFPPRLVLRYSIYPVKEGVSAEEQRVRMLSAFAAQISPRLYYHGIDEEQTEISILEFYDTSLDDALRSDDDIADEFRKYLVCLRNKTKFSGSVQAMNSLLLADKVVECLKKQSKLFPGEYVHGCFDLAPRNWVVNNWQTSEFKLAQIDLDSMFCTSKIDVSDVRFVLRPFETRDFDKHIIPTLKLCLSREGLSFVEPDRQIAPTAETLQDAMQVLMIAVCSCIWLPTITIDLDGNKSEHLNYFYQWATKNVGFIFRNLYHAYALYCTFDLGLTIDDCNLEGKRHFLQSKSSKDSSVALKFVEKNYNSSCGKQISATIDNVYAFGDPLSVLPLGSQQTFRPLLSVGRTQPHITFLSIIELLFAPSLVIASKYNRHSDDESDTDDESDNDDESVSTNKSTVDDDTTNSDN